MTDTVFLGFKVDPSADLRRSVGDSTEPPSLLLLPLDNNNQAALSVLGVFLLVDWSANYTPVPTMPKRKAEEVRELDKTVICAMLYI